MRAERRREPTPGVAADVGHDVGAVADAAQRRSGHRQHRPADLVAVRAGDHAARARVAGARRQQRQRRGRAEPHGVDVVCSAISRRIRSSTVGHGQHQRGRMAHDLVAGRACRVVELVGALPLSARTRSACVRRPIAARWSTSSCRYDWMPPRRGGKSLVTSRTRVIAVRLSRASHCRHSASTSPRSAPRRLETAVGCRRGHGRRPRRTAARRRDVAVLIGDEPGEPPRAVVGASVRAAPRRRGRRPTAVCATAACAGHAASPAGRRSRPPPR